MPDRPAAWALHTDVDLDAVNVHLLALEEAGLLGISEADGRATVYLPARVDSLPLEGRWEPVAERDWNAEWQRSVRPVVVGAFTIVPPWLADGAPGDVVVIEPAQAFGTGHHETTVGCLAALQGLDVNGRAVADVGCGTGVLAICAARLGATPVVAVDTDPLAVAAARDNAARNGVAVDVRLGSTGAVPAPVDVVVANLDTDAISRSAADLATILRPGGTLVASGVSNERRGEAETALAAAGLALDVAEGREWTVLRGRR